MEFFSFALNEEATPAPTFGAGEPRTFDQVIGQEGVVNTLRTAVKAAVGRGGRLPHTLLADTRPGVGKTALAKVAAAEMGTGFLRVMGSLTVHEGVRVLQKLSDRDILFWDEIHLARKVEWLLGYMDSVRSVVLPSGPVNVPDVTVVAATTNPERLSEPLVSRFVLRPRFAAYSEKDMERMLNRVIKNKEVRSVIVTVANGNPRELRRLESIALDVTSASSHNVAPRLLEQAGYGRSGLPAAAEDVLMFLHSSPSFTAGAATLRSTIGQECSSAEKLLIQKGLMSVSGKGRQLTATGVDAAMHIKRIYGGKS